MSACPPGFDCAFLNSCPAIIKPCPEGFLCSSYAGHPQQGDIDLSYAKMKNIYTDVAVTEKNKEDFVVPDRAVQSRCYAGFYCPNATIILVGRLLHSLLACPGDCIILPAPTSFPCSPFET